MSRFRFFDIIVLLLIFLLSSLFFGALFYQVTAPWIAPAWVVSTGTALFGYVRLTRRAAVPSKYIRPGMDADQRTWSPLRKKTE